MNEVGWTEISKQQKKEKYCEMEWLFVNNTCPFTSFVLLPLQLMDILTLV